MANAKEYFKNKKDELHAKEYQEKIKMLITYILSFLTAYILSILQ